MDVGVLEYGCWMVGFLSPVIHPLALKCPRFAPSDTFASPQPCLNLFIPQIIKKGCKNWLCVS